MRVIQDIKKDIPAGIFRPVVALGVFDGVHLGHQQVIKWVVRQAKRSGGTSVVLTFSPHPLKVLYRQTHAPLITSLEHRLDLIKRLDVDLCLVINFDREFSQISAEDFIKQVLVQAIGVQTLIVGEGFRFGKKKKGSLSLLRRSSRKLGFKIEKVKPVKVKGKIISSSKIRQLIKKGDMPQAKILLGRDFSILGRVVRGTARGRILGFPTANIEPQQEIIPLPGVYAVEVKMEGYERIFPGVLNIGRRPTFPEKKKTHPTIETHIFNFHQDIYDKRLEVFFVQRIRAEKRFSAVHALRTQIARDERQAKAVLKSKPLP